MKCFFCSVRPGCIGLQHAGAAFLWSAYCWNKLPLVPVQLTCYCFWFKSCQVSEEKKFEDLDSGVWEYFKIKCFRSVLIFYGSSPISEYGSRSWCHLNFLLKKKKSDLCLPLYLRKQLFVATVFVPFIFIYKLCSLVWRWGAVWCWWS